MVFTNADSIQQVMMLFDHVGCAQPGFLFSVGPPHSVAENCGRLRHHFAVEASKIGQPRLNVSLMEPFHPFAILNV